MKKHISCRTVWLAVGVIMATASCSSDSKSIPAPDEESTSSSSAQTAGVSGGQLGEAGTVETSAAGRQPAGVGTLLAGGSEQAVMSLPDPPGAMDAVVLLPDGDRAAVCGEDGKIRVYQVSSHEVVASFDGYIGTPLLAVSDDGKLLAQASGQDSRAKVWDIQAQRERRMLEGRGQPISDIVFSPDGGRLATASKSSAPDAKSEILVWSLTEDSAPARLEADCGVSALAFSPDGGYLASAGLSKLRDDGTSMAQAAIWNLATGQAEAAVDNLLGNMYQVAFSPDGKTLAIAESNGLSPAHVADRIRLVDPLTGDPKGLLFGHVGKIQGMAFTPDGQCLVSAGQDGQMRIWDVPTMSLRSFRDLNGYSGSRVTFSRSGERFAIAAGRDASEIHPIVWDFNDALQVEPSAPGLEPFHVRILKSKTQMEIDKLVYSSDGKTLACLSRSTGTMMYDTGSWSGRRVPGSTRLRPHSFSPDLKKAVLLDKTLMIWNLANIQDMVNLEDPVRTPYSIVLPDAVFSPDGQQLVSTHFDDRSLRMRDVQSRQLVAAAYQPEGAGTCIAYSSDGASLVTGSSFFRLTHPSANYCGLVCIWDTAHPVTPREGQVDTLHDTVERDVSEEVRSAFAKTCGYYKQGGGDRAFAKGLQNVLSELSEIELSTDRNEYRYQRLTLNVTGERVDAVRFTIPDGDPVELMWIVDLGREIRDCRIVPASGDPLEAKEIVVYAHPIYQRQPTFEGTLARVLVGPGIQPGKEYLVCFALGTDEAVDTEILIRAIPQGSFLREGWSPAAYRPFGDLPMLRRTRVFFNGAPVTGVALSPDGSKAASIGTDGLATLWDVDSAEAVATYPSEIAAFSPNGRMLATTGAGEEVTTIVLRDVESGDRVRGLSGGHIRRVTALAFSPDGQRLASGGSDGLVTVWDPETGQQAWNQTKANGR